jgi:hypothetical protein
MSDQEKKQWQAQVIRVLYAQPDAEKKARQARFN